MGTSEEPLRFSLKKVDVPDVRVRVKGLHVRHESLEFKKNGADIMLGKHLYSCILPPAFKENFKGLVVGVVLEILF